MTHAEDDPNRGNYDDPLASPTYILGIIGTVILIATVFLVQKLSHDAADEFAAKAAERDYLEISQMREKQESQLEGYHWTFPEEDRASVPIGEGVQAVLEQYGRGQ